jgi:sensor histidine kinase YesM
MSFKSQTSTIQKQLPALAAALATSLVVGLAVVALGANALANANSTPLKGASGGAPAANGDQATIQQLQNEVSQYQAREQQYQTELNQAAQLLNQTQNRIQQYQSLINALQDAGVIQITQDGRVFLSGGLGIRSGPSGGD